MEEQSKWDDGAVDFGVKSVTEYTDAELRLAFGALAQKVEQMEIKNDVRDVVTTSLRATAE